MMIMKERETDRQTDLHRQTIHRREKEKSSVCCDTAAHSRVESYLPLSIKILDVYILDILYLECSDSTF